MVADNYINPSGSLHRHLALLPGAKSETGGAVAGGPAPSHMCVRCVGDLSHVCVVSDLGSVTRVCVKVRRHRRHLGSW